MQMSKKQNKLIWFGGFLLVAIYIFYTAFLHHDDKFSGTWKCDIHATIEHMNKAATHSRVYPWLPAGLSDDEKVKRQEMLDGYVMKIDMKQGTVVFAAKGFSNGFHFKNQPDVQSSETITLVPLDERDPLNIKLRPDGTLAVWAGNPANALILQKM